MLKHKLETNFYEKKLNIAEVHWNISIISRLNRTQEAQFNSPINIIEERRNYSWH